MYKAFFGLISNPFNLSPDPAFLYRSPHHEEALANLIYGVQSRKGFILLTGEVGTGKTTMLECLRDHLDSHDIPFAFVFNSRLTADQFFEMIAYDLDLPCSRTSKTEVLFALNTMLLERANLDDRYTVPAEAVAVGGSTAQLREGEEISVRDLLTGLLVASGNDAAVTLADGVAGSQAAFVDMMNARAKELGLRHTHYANPHGLDEPGHYSTVRDLVTLARVAMENPEFREKLSGMGAIPVGGSPEEFGDILKRENAKWGKAIKDANIHLE